MGPWYSASIWALMTSFHNAIAAVGKIRTGLCELSRRLVASGILLRLQRQQMLRVHAEAEAKKDREFVFNRRGQYSLTLFLRLTPKRKLPVLVIRVKLGKYIPFDFGN